MASKHSISVTRPISTWNKPLKVSFRDFFKSLTKTGAQSAAGSFAGASKDAIDAISAVSVGDDLGGIAWVLIYRSLIEAIYTLVDENEALLMRDPENPNVVRHKLGVPPDDPDAFVNQLDLSLEKHQLAIDEDFFQSPRSLTILAEISKPFSQWLQGFGLGEAQAKAIVDHVPSYFVFALNNQWRARPDEYAPLKKAFDTPFTKASEKEQAWSRYSAWLQKLIDEPMFDEAFSLRQVYVPLRTYYEKKTKPAKDVALGGGVSDETTESIVVDPVKNLEGWLSGNDSRDAVRVISGGPGSGKSSFAKMFAAHVAAASKRRVLFIPLHQFEPSDDLIDAVGNFVRLGQLLPHNPIDPDDGDSSLLTIFDGLDELAMQGKVGAELAQQFVSEVIRKAELLNSRDGSRLKVLISGRDLAVQETAGMFRRPYQILHALPYFVPEEERSAYKDSGGLLARDQRQQWWGLYGAANGQGYLGLPEELMRSDLEEITSQPLLNYLVALSFERKVLDLSKESNLNRIYEDLLKAVYERKWASNPHPATKDVEEEHFIRILEEIAVAAWHGDGRTTTVAEIEEHCERAGLKRLLMALQEGASKGVTRLLMAFYFRAAGSRQTGDRTFEFTHKSFGEYLTARRIVGVLRHLHDELERQKQSFDSSFNEQLALELWMRLCGPVTMDNYVLGFIKNEIMLQEKDQIQRWQETLCRLISFMLTSGMPMERVSPRPGLIEENKQARNAEESLLVVLNACATLIGRVSTINWPSTTACGEWIARLQGQRQSDANVLALDSLSYLDMRGCILYVRDLYHANLSWSLLQDAKLTFAVLTGADLTGANLEEALLFSVNLERAVLTGANLRGTHISNATLAGADLVGVSFEGARLDGARLYLKTCGWAKIEEGQLSPEQLSELADGQLRELKLKFPRWKIPQATNRRR